MRRLWLFVLLFCLRPGGAAGQTLPVVHIKVVLVDAAQKVTPVAGHALLISDEPPTSSPRRVVTGLDGTVDVRLRPAVYVIESNQAVAIAGQGYEWRHTIEVVAGQDATVELNAGNANIVTGATSGTTVTDRPLESDPYVLLPRWRHSVVALWTPTTHASGFVIDGRGLVATNQRVVRDATSVEVQLSARVKVRARVVASDPARNVAILWAAPDRMAEVPPIPLACADATRPSVDSTQQKMFAIAVSLWGEASLTVGSPTRVDLRSTRADFRLPPGSSGGPVFTPAGAVVGITAMADSSDDRGVSEVEVVPVDDVCRVRDLAEQAMLKATPPSGALLPVEPERSTPPEASQATARSAVDASAYQVASSEFDVVFITPPLLQLARQAAAPGRRSLPARGARPTAADLVRAEPLQDFANWSSYVAERPAVLLVRVTPRLVEGFWTTVARGAAYTQGVAIPAIKRFKTSFARMRVLCGDDEVIPIHPFVLERPVSKTESIREGLYAIDPKAVGPQCGSVKVVLYSEKDPEKGETKLVDSRVLQQIRQDFTP